MKEILKEIGYYLEDKLKRLCGAPTPGKRIAFVVILISSGAAINFYFLFSSIYNMGKSDAVKETIKIEHIDSPILIPENLNDSIPFKNPLKELKG
jgi:hypothetical protein